MIEIHFILPKEYKIGHIEKFDEIRAEISNFIGKANPDRWLTIAFTAKPEWLTGAFSKKCEAIFGQKYGKDKQLTRILGLSNTECILDCRE